jgi:hypothetical protein
MVRVTSNEELNIIIATHDVTARAPHFATHA